MTATVNDSEIYETWSPLIEMKFGPISEKRLRTLCRYAHYHALFESSFLYKNSNGMAGLAGVIPPKDWKFNPTEQLTSGEASLLPMCLSVLAKVKNLDDIKLTSGADSIAIERYQVSWDISRDIIQDLKNSSIDVISLIEEKLAEKAISFIEDQIEQQINNATGDGLVDMRDTIIVMNTNVIIESIMTISEGSFAPKMALKLAFGFKTYK